MGTTITPADLTITITESVTLNGVNFGSTLTQTVEDIAEISKRIITVTTTESVIATFSTAVGQGIYIAAKVKYIRFTNLDNTNFITLTFKDEDNTEFRIKVDAGQSFIYNGDNSGGLVDTMKSNGSALSSGLADLYDITADADTASCDLEMIIAST